MVTSTEVLKNDTLKNEVMIRAMSYRERDRQVTDVRQFYNNVVEKAYESNDNEVISLSLDSFIKYFRDLQKGGVGKLVEGRNGKATRFYWNYKASSVVDTIKGKGNLELYTRSTPARSPKPSEAPKKQFNIKESTIVLVLPLSTGMIRFEIPGNLTDADRTLLARTIQSVLK